VNRQLPDPNFFRLLQLAFAHELIGNSPERCAGKSAIDSAFRLRPTGGSAPALAWHLGFSSIMTARAPSLLLLNKVYRITRKYELAESMDGDQRRG